MKKSILRNLVVVALLLGLLIAPMHAVRAQGASVWDGTYPTTRPAGMDDGAGDLTIDIYTAEEFAWIMSVPNMFLDGVTGVNKVLLHTDIDLASHPWTPSVAAGPSQSNTFDGGGHTIRNLFVDGGTYQSSNNRYFLGLFGRVPNAAHAKIQNLTVDGAVLNGSTTVRSYAGVITGSEDWMGHYENVHVRNATITASKYVGAIAAYGTSNMTNVSAENITFNITQIGEDKPHVGGLMGLNNAGTIENSPVSNLTITISHADGTTLTNQVGALFGTAQSGVFIGSDNPIADITYNGATFTTLVGLDNRTGKVRNTTQGTSFETITDAVNASVDGDVILVSAGTYDEENILISKGIQLLGTGDGNTVITPSGATNNSTIKVVNPSGNVLIDGFTFNNPPRPSHGATILTSGTAIAVDSATVTVSNNIINGADRGQYNDYGLYGQGNHAAVIWEYNTLNLVGGNPLIFEQQLGSTTVRNNTVYTGDVADGSLYYSMIYGDKTVTTPQIVENNTLSFVRTGDGWSEAITFNTSPTYQWSGSTLYGHYTDIQIRNNTIILGGIKDRGIGLADRSAGAGKGTITGAVIEGNTITGQEEHVNESTVGILLRGDVQGTEIKNNTFTTLASGVQLIEQLVNTTPEHEVPSGTIIENNTFNSSVGVALKNENTEEQVDASPNYWGSADGPSGEDLDGAVKFFPFWIDPEMTQLSQVTNTTLAMDLVTLEACEIESEYIVSVNIGPFYDMSSYQIKVSFDTTKLEVLELINGDVLPGDAIEIKKLGNDTGVLDYSRTLYGNQGDWNLIDDPDGGTLMKIKVKTKAAGTSVMELLNTSILTRTDDAWNYPYDITNATTTVTTSLYAVRNGAKSYCDLQTAVDEANAGDTLTVLRDFTVAAPVEVAKEITFNTVDYTVTRTNAGAVADPFSDYDSLFKVLAGGNLTIKGNGTLDAQNDAHTKGAALRIVGGQVTLTENVTLKGDYVSVRVEGNIAPGAGNPATSAVFNMTGGTVADGIVVVGNGGKLDLSGGSVTSEDYAPISGNGRNDTGVNYSGTEIILSGTVLVERDDDVAIYHPQDGTLTIKDNAQVIGTNGVEMRAGDFIMTGGVVKGIGTELVTAPEAGKSWDTGDALLITSIYEPNISVNISGGLLESAHAYAFREYVSGATTKVTSIEVTGGTFDLTNGNVMTDAVSFATVDSAILKLTGGTYKEDPAEFVFFPLETYLHTDNYYHIRYMWPVINTDTGVIYETLALAVADAQAGETLQARLDFETTAPASVEKTIIFDTNGKTITRANASSPYSAVFNVMTGGDLTITGTGTVKSTNTEKTRGTPVVVYGGELNLESATLSGGYASVAVFADFDTVNPTPGTFNMSSGMTTDGVIVQENGSTFNLTGGTVKTTANKFAIAGNGSAGYGGTIINISGDAKVISEQTIAIYHPQDGTLTISGNAEISGPSAIQMKAGDLTISGNPTITATGAFVANPEPPSNGAEPTGDAIFIASQTGYTGDLNLNISGGTITSTNGYAVREIVASETTKLVNATISDGQLSGGAGAVVFASNTDAILDLIGAAYSTDPSAFVYIPKYVYFDDPWYRIGDMVGAVTGTVSMQGRTTRAGVPVTMTGGSVVIPTVTSTDDPGVNLSFAYLVPNTTYTITTAQPRYLNITSDMLKNKFIVNGTETLATLRLIAGNTIWTNNIIDVNDYGFVGGKYGFVGETDADANFDGVVNIRDLALVGGNFGLTNATAYQNWTP